MSDEKAAKRSHKNRLSRETSPYLLQHAHNPVDWYPWGKDALEKAKREQKPIFLSIGYSACHWCHVMEKESFEDETTAKVMNEHFVNIKVDREERPDLDHIYMSAVQVMTQHGGWPMSVFLTPNLEPFYGGTYFPPEDRMGMPSFKRILAGVANAWATKRDEVSRSAEQLVAALASLQHHSGQQSTEGLSLALVDRAASAIHQSFDPTYGGFGGAPKFFHAMDLKLALRHWKRTGDPKSLAVVTVTLDHIANGGIYDHLGGGFHRYSTDARWLVPHFEKMLYDNALLSEVYLEAYQATQNVDFARVAREILNYVLREMTDSRGGFYSTQDADSEGVEGKFYVWSKKEIFELLDRDTAEQFCKIYDVTEHGNWEHTNILNRPKSLEASAKALGLEKDWLEDSLSAAIRKLFAAREKRIHPFRDEKILTSWNGLMIHSFAMGYAILGDIRYLEAAKNASSFILEHLAVNEEARPRNAKGKAQFALLHCYKDSQARFSGYLDDYANLANALVTLYEADFAIDWLMKANEIADSIIDFFWDAPSKGFYYTSRHHEALVTRPRENHDGATPAASFMALTALARLGRLLGKTDYLKIVEQGLESLQNQMQTIPTASGQCLCALDFLLSGPIEIVLAPHQPEGHSEDSDGALEAMLEAVRKKFLPSKVIAMAKKDTVKLPELNESLKGKASLNGKTAAYVCENYTCQAPVTDTPALIKLLEKR